MLVILSLLLILPVFTADITSASPQSYNTKNVTIDLSAKDLGFNVSTITVPAGANVTINFDNLDQGVEHNFALYETAEATKSVFVGEEITGPGKIAYNFDAPTKVGTYFFRCDDHPTEMKGNFTVQ